MLSQTVEHALRATLYIARDHPRSVRVTDIATGIDAPRNYLAKVLGLLVRGGILESSRGPTGGFRLRSRADEVSLSDIARVFHPVAPRRCLLGLGDCGQNPSCAVHVRWLPIAQATDGFFATTTIADLLSTRTLT